MHILSIEAVSKNYGIRPLSENVTLGFDSTDRIGIVGANGAVMNELLNLIIKSGNIDREFIAEHTVGFEELREVVSEHTPERVQELTGVPTKKLRAAARLLGNAEKLFSTVLQGFYQSHQATAASVQVNNLNLIRGMIGKPGCGLLQMNGQPTAENTRETGCDGEFPAFRNWHNPAHLDDLAERWNVEPAVIPHWHLPAHAMEIFRHAETGSIKFLWIICTNPAVSLPGLHRIRKILSQEKLFVVALAIVMQASKELRDEVLLAACIYMVGQNKRQQAWLITQIEHRASHTLVVPQ
jgi:ferredoxin-nitrate reductase